MNDICMADLHDNSILVIFNVYESMTKENVEEMKKFHHSQLILNGHGLISCHPPTFPSGTDIRQNS
jgi:hypothetical protein